MVSAIVLAAGLSKRMGTTNKLLLKYKSRTVIETVVENILAAGINEVIVVTGHEHERIQNALSKLPVKTAYNPAYETGMTTSIQTGLTHAHGNGYMVCLSDMVLIEPTDYNKLMHAFEKQFQLDEKCICVPVFNNQKGNPVTFSSFYKELILQNKEMDGCKNIVATNKQHIHSTQMNTANILTDIDYPADYERLNQPTGSQ